jgi:hypothetical protein
MAGELDDWLVGLCESRGVSVPHSSWKRVRAALAQTTGKPPQAIRLETFLARDLGFS